MPRRQKCYSIAYPKEVYYLENYYN